MVRFQRQALPKFGKFPQAIQWAKVFAEYMTKNHAVNFRIFVESNGAIHWIADYPDYDALGRVRTKILSDSEYWGHISRASDLFVEGSINDSVMNLVE